MANVQAAIDKLSESEAAALARTRGLKDARDGAVAALVKLLTLLKAYVQGVADENPEFAPSIIESARFFETLYSNPINIEESCMRADLVIGAVLVTGAAAPKLVSKELVSKMSKGSVIVDVAVDQGGCIETCKPTTHDHPTFEVDGIVHYCVANMPGAVPHTSTWALTNTTIQYAVKIAELGVVAAAKSDKALLAGFNTYGGHVVYEPVAQAHKLEYVPVAKLLG